MGGKSQPISVILADIDLPHIIPRLGLAALEVVARIRKGRVIGLHAHLGLRATLAAPEPPPNLGAEPNLLVIGAEHDHFPHLMVPLYHYLMPESTREL